MECPEERFVASTRSYRRARPGGMGWHEVGGRKGTAGRKGARIVKGIVLYEVSGPPRSKRRTGLQVWFLVCPEELPLALVTRSSFPEHGGIWSSTAAFTSRNVEE
jgi:hypothetical protein